jgi:hypothetical protein
VTAWNKLRPSVLLGYLRSSHHESNGGLASHVALVVPLADLGVMIMIDVIAVPEVMYGSDTDSLRFSPHQNQLRVVRKWSQTA